MQKMNSYYAFGQQIITDLNFDDWLPKPSAELDTLHINQKKIDTAIKQPTRIYRKGIRANFYKNTNSVFMSWEGIAKFESRQSELNFELTGKDLGSFKLFLLSEPFGCSLFENFYFLLHGSAVLVDGHAHVFTGEPGAGKSTTVAAFYKTGKTILSDDLVVIKIINNKPYVIPSLPHLKIWKNSILGLNLDASNLMQSFEGIDKFLIVQDLENFPQFPIPLSSITHLLAPNSRKKDKEFGIIEAPTELLKHFPLPVQILKKEKLALHFQTSILIAKSTILKQMKRPKNFEALQRFVNTF